MRWFAKLLGEPELPPKVGACFFFIIMTGLLFLLVDPFPQLYGFRKIPQVWG